MGIKCSVFGHRFGDTEVTRDREERGSEVVTTITETETCERCGETRVVSENTEVTTLETPSEIIEGTTDDADGDGGDTPGIGRSGGRADGPPIDEAGDRTGEAATPAGDSAGTGDGLVGGPDPDPDPDEEDAVILDETPDTDEESEGRAPGEWPDETGKEAGEEEWVPDMTDVTETGGLPSVESEQPDIESTGEAATVPEGEFRCPECGFTTAVDSSSLREGDFCPECHRGALEQHPEG